MAVSLLALFVALGGAGYAATGDNFILGMPNTATTPSTLTANQNGKALQITNTDAAAGATALGLNVANGHAPFTVNSKTKVANLNSDQLDGVDSSGYVRKGIQQNVAVNAAPGVISVTNTGTTNGIQGMTSAVAASGLYGENIGIAGFGVAGRAGNSGHAIYGDNTGSGFAGFFEDKVGIGGNLELGGTLECSGCVSASDVTGKVADADTLDGIDSAGFIRGGGNADGQAVALAPNTIAFVGPAIGGLIRLRYTCPFGIGGNGTLRIINSSPSLANLFVDSGGANPDFLQLASGGFIDYPAAAGGESFFIQMQGSPGVALVSVATVHRSSTNDCHAQALGVIAQ